MPNSGNDFHLQFSLAILVSRLAVLILASLRDLPTKTIAEISSPDYLQSLPAKIDDMKLIEDNVRLERIPHIEWEWVTDPVSLSDTSPYYYPHSYGAALVNTLNQSFGSY